MSITEETGTIILGGVKHPIGYLNLDQLEHLLPALEEYQAATLTTWGARKLASAPTIKAARQAFAIVLGKDDAEAGSIRASTDEIFVAIDEIMRVAGLVSLGELITRMTPQAAPSISTASEPTS